MRESNGKLESFSTSRNKTRLTTSFLHEIIH